MSIRSLVALAAPALVLTFASAPSQAEDINAPKTLAMIEWSCSQTSVRKDSRQYLRCVEETARQMLISTAPRQPYGVEIISGEPLDDLADQLAESS
jgi:hypothetical protein